MGIFKTPSVSTSTSTESTSEAEEEKEETAATKARLLETDGGNKGAELLAQQGKSVRRIFG